MTSKSTHDPYPHPAVAEALCEIHFAAAQGVAWNQQWFGDLFRRIEADFPSMEPQQIIEVGSTVGPQGISQNILPTLRVQYRHRSRPHRVHLSPSTLTVNEVAPYPGWAQFLLDIQKAWEDVLAVAKPASVVRIGLRYINQASKGRPEEPLSEWLAECDYYPRRLLSSNARYHSRFEFVPEAGVRVIVTVAEPRAVEGRASFLLDIDAVLEAPLEVGWKTLEPEVDRLHDRVWEVFASSLTPRFETYLREGH